MRQRERIQRFVSVLWDWFDHHKRDLPWRDLRITDDAQRAYQILVSEVMLQQTQVARVITVYQHFLQLFPELQDLADASNKDVLLAWRGMGYNSRALRLRDAAKEIVQLSEVRSTKYEVRRNCTFFPSTMNELTAIKGIGPYTAAAIRNFAFHLPTPCLDTNIRRVLHRAFYGPEHPEIGRAHV